MHVPRPVGIAVQAQVFLVRVALRVERLDVCVVRRGLIVCVVVRVRVARASSRASSRDRDRVPVASRSRGVRIRRSARARVRTARQGLDEAVASTGKVCVDLIDRARGLHGRRAGEAARECRDGAVGFEIRLGNTWIRHHLAKCRFGTGTSRRARGDAIGEGRRAKACVTRHTRVNRRRRRRRWR